MVNEKILALTARIQGALHPLSEAPSFKRQLAQALSWRLTVVSARWTDGEQMSV